MVTRSSSTPKNKGGVSTNMLGRGTGLSTGRLLVSPSTRPKHPKTQSGKLVICSGNMVAPISDTYQEKVSFTAGVSQGDARSLRPHRYSLLTFFVFSLPNPNLAGGPRLDLELSTQISERKEP